MPEEEFEGSNSRRTQQVKEGDVIGDVPHLALTAFVHEPHHVLDVGQIVGKGEALFINGLEVEAHALGRPIQDLIHGEVIVKAKHLDLVSGNGSLNVDRAGVINLESSFSAVDMDEVGMLNVSSSYDGYEIDEVGILDMTSFFGAFEIDRVGKTVEAMLTYGSLEIDHIAADFKKVEIEAEFSSVEIEFDDKASNTLNATATAGDIEGPKGINSEVVHSSNHLNQTLNGTVGANPGERTVTIKVSQGGIEID